MAENRCPICFEDMGEEKWYSCGKNDDPAHVKAIAVKESKKRMFGGKTRKAKSIASKIGISYNEKNEVDFWKYVEKGLFMVNSDNANAIVKCPICENPRVTQRVCPKCKEKIDPKEKITVISVVGENQDDINRYIAATIYQIKEVLLNIGHEYIITFDDNAKEAYKKISDGSLTGESSGELEAVKVTFKTTSKRHSFAFVGYKFVKDGEGDAGIKKLVESDYMIYLVKAQEFVTVMKKLGTSESDEGNSNVENDVDKFIEFLKKSIIQHSKNLEVMIGEDEKIKIKFGLVVTGKEDAKKCTEPGRNENAYNSATSTIIDDYGKIFDKMKGNIEGAKKELVCFNEIMLPKIIDAAFEKPDYFFVTTPTGKEVDLDILTPFMYIADQLSEDIVRVKRSVTTD